MSRLPVVVQAGGRNDFTHVCHYVSGLTFAKSGQGGDISARMRLDIDPARLPDLGQRDRVAILNPRTGAPLWMGYVEDPGRHAGGFELSVTGGYTRATDVRAPLIYVDQSLDAWIVEKAGNNANNVNAAESDDPTAATTSRGLLMQFPPGQPVATNSAIKMTYVFGDQQFGTIFFSKKAGLTSADYAASLVTQGTSGVVTAGLAPLGSVETTDRAHSNFAGPSGSPGQIAEGIKRLSFQFFRDGAAANVATDNVWMWWHAIQTYGRRMDRYGTLLTGNHAIDFGSGASGRGVSAQQVIEDLLGRLLPGVDSSTALVDMPTPDEARIIAQLVYRDPVHAATVFGDLAFWEPELTWAIDAPLTLDGLHRGRWHTWDYTRPRYTITREHAFEPHPGKVELANRLTVTWTSDTGKRETYVATADVPEMRGDTRDAEPIHLPEGVGSQLDAQRIGDAWLASIVARPRSGSAVVYGPILDEWRGIYVDPAEIETGYTALVADTGDVLRVAEVEYDDEAQAMKVDLGEPELTLEQLVQTRTNLPQGVA